VKVSGLLDGSLDRWRLRGCTTLGKRPVLRGAPKVMIAGRLDVGDDLLLSSVPVQSHLWVVGAMRVGDRVRIGAGAAISAMASIEIGDDVAIGDYCILMDSDFHRAGDFHAAVEPKPVRIESGAQLGHRVVVLPGATVGHGAVVLPGSVVSGAVLPKTVVGGNPARPDFGAVAGALDGTSAAAAAEVPRLVMKVLGLAEIPTEHAGPADIAQWDSLGALRLLIALEETFGITLAEDAFRSVRTVRDLVGQVEAAALRRSSNASTP
jgi:acetyltransferase-like isoleucine patch superfamily enzyme/acyl carrier protein